VSIGAVEVQVALSCACCGDRLAVAAASSGTDGTHLLSVEPCKRCLEDAKMGREGEGQEIRRRLEERAQKSREADEQKWQAIDEEI